MLNQEPQGRNGKYLNKDPVCGIEVDPGDSEFSFRLKDETYFFCSSSYQKKFLETPEKP